MAKLISTLWILFGIYILMTNDVENHRLFLYFFVTVLLIGGYILHTEKSGNSN